MLFCISSDVDGLHKYLHGIIFSIAVKPSMTSHATNVSVNLCRTVNAKMVETFFVKVIKQFFFGTEYPKFYLAAYFKQFCQLKHVNSFFYSIYRCCSLSPLQRQLQVRRREWYTYIIQTLFFSKSWKKYSEITVAGTSKKWSGKEVSI